MVNSLKSGQIESTDTSDRTKRVQEKEKLLGDCLTFEQAIASLAKYMIFAEDVKATFARLQSSAAEDLQKSNSEIDEFCDRHLWVLGVAESYIDKSIQATESAALRGKNAADALHNLSGGSRAKAAAIREVWATGNYSNRDLCAEKECAALKMSFGAARKALRNTPTPPSRCGV